MMQTTLLTPFRCAGVGLHSGTQVEVVVLPAPAGTGIQFVLATSQGRVRLVPRPETVVATRLATTLGQGDVRVATVEHLLAALLGMDVDNAIVEVHGSEVPIMDGSALSFARLIQNAGLRQLPLPRRVARVCRPIMFRDGQRSVRAYPYDGLHISCRIDFDHPSIGRQEYTVELSPQSFMKEIAPARTFGFLRDVERLRDAGLALGGSLANAVVLDEKGPINPDGLRFADEMVRHKILDFLGDIAVSPQRLQGRFVVERSGHETNNRFLRALLADSGSIQEIELQGRPRRAAAVPVPWPRVGVPEPAL